MGRVSRRRLRCVSRVWLGSRHRGPKTLPQSNRSGADSSCVPTPSAIGFLIAAKSVFRFGELSDRANRLEAEYITIGTLLSFAIGVAVSMATARVLLLV